MKSFIITLFAVFATSMTAMAQRVNMVYTLHVNTADGNSVAYEFEKEPIATFEDGILIVAAKASETLQFMLDNVTSITFSGEASSIDCIASNDTKQTVLVSGNEITIRGLKAAGKVAVYDAGGRMCVSSLADADGCVVINISDLGKGVFIVNTPNNSIKFIK